MQSWDSFIVSRVLLLLWFSVIFHIQGVTSLTSQNLTDHRFYPLSSKFSCKLQMCLNNSDEKGLYLEHRLLWTAILFSLFSQFPG